MDETEVEKQLRDMEVPPASEGAKRRTREQAWGRLRRGRTSSFAFGSPLSRVASVLLVVGVGLGLLSYSVTQSTRSGGGDAQKETSKLGSAQITQYPASVRTSIVRMIIGNADVTKLRFNKADEYETLDSPVVGVFHPEGGQATYVRIPGDLMAEGESGDWAFNAELALKLIGTDDVDIVAYLPGVTQTVCSSINQELGIHGMPQLRSDQSGYYTRRMVDDGVQDYVFPMGSRPFLDSPDLAGWPFGCFQSHDGKKFVYYHVLIER